MRLIPIGLLFLVATGTAQAQNEAKSECSSYTTDSLSRLIAAQDKILARVNLDLEAVPECIRNAGGSPPKVVIDTSPDFLNAISMPDMLSIVREMRDLLASGSIGVAKTDANPEAQKPRRSLDWELRFGAALYADDWAERMAERFYTTPEALRAVRFNQGTALHESTHRWHQSMPEKVDAFSRIQGGYYDKLAAFSADSEVVAARANIRALGKRTPELKSLLERYGTLYRKHGFPVRFPNDTHAVDDDHGGEYFAMTVEMFAMQPENFCKYLNAEEVRWLKDNLGDCLEQIKTKRPSCW